MKFNFFVRTFFSQHRAKQSSDYASLADKRHALQGKRSLKKNDKDFHKQFPCKRFKRDQCELGDKCKYDHPDKKAAADDVETVSQVTDKNNDTKEKTNATDAVTMET